MLKELKEAKQGYYFVKTGNYEWHNTIIEITGEAPFLKIKLIANLGNESNLDKITSIYRIEHPDRGDEYYES